MPQPRAASHPRLGFVRLPRVSAAVTEPTPDARGTLPWGLAAGLGALASALVAWGSAHPEFAFHPDGWLDQYDPATFKYAISAREVKA